MEGIFLDIGLVIISAALLGVVSFFLKQPLILAYVAAGILLGPTVTGLLHEPEFIEAISHIGVMLMLFLIGLEMNTSKLKDLGLVSLAVGIGQVVLTAGAGYLIASSFGYTGLVGAYIAIALAFSSTVIAVKIMSEKRDLNSMYGQITIGVLIVQDILAVLALLSLGGFSGAGDSFSIMTLAELLVGGAVLATITMLFSRYILSHLYSAIATSQELLILFSLSWCFIVAIAAKYLGFSMEIGAFIAGVNLANLPYTFEINSKAKLLRDFFITLFFVSLGAGMQFGDISSILLPFLTFTFFILIGNPIIVMCIMGALGYDKKNSFYTGLTIANVSEFSLILITLGAGLGHIGPDVVAALTMATIVTMVISSYMITYNYRLYRVLRKPLSIFEFRKRKTKKSPAKSMEDHIILLGYGDTGKQILKQVETFKEDYVVVDHDNKVIKELIEKETPCVFGDVEDEELLDELSLETTEVIISTLPNHEDNYFLFKKLKEIPETKRPICIVVAPTGRVGLDLFIQGADYVIVKSFLGANQVFHLNRELYGLTKEHFEELSKHKAGNPTQKQWARDIDYATFLENLNGVRLKELQKKLKKKKQTKKKT